ncbi:MAG: hypothetical protein IPK72_15635 [Candidatus Eisenbacteria bacterium]|nr:hypothetical protein [Candidatus Eisenbacteria bacterium]
MRTVNPEPCLFFLARSALCALLAILPLTARRTSAQCVDYRTRLHRVGYCEAPNDANDLTIRGTYAYGAHGNSGIGIYSIADPANPTLLGTVDTPGYARRLSLVGSHLFVADASGVAVLSLANPVSPALVASVALPLEPPYFDLAAVGDYVYVLSIGGLITLHVSNPANPVVVSTYADIDGSLVGITDYGAYLFIGDENILTEDHDLHVFSLANPAEPALAASVESFLSSWSALWRMDAADGRLLINYGQAGTTVVGIADPLHPVPSNRGTGSDACVAIRGNTAFLGGWGLTSARFSPSNAPKPDGSLKTLYQTGGMAIGSGFAYCLEGRYQSPTGAFEVFDISDPLGIKPLGNLELAGTTTGIALSGSHAFLASGGMGLRVTDITDPGEPVLVTTLETPGYLYDVESAGNYLVGSEGESGVRIFDLSNPAAPAMIGVADTPTYAYRAAVVGSLAFVADAETGLAVIDFAKPSAPTLIGSVVTSGRARDVAITGDRALVVGTNGPNGFVQAIDVSNPASPVALGSLAVQGQVLGIATVGSLAYAAVSGTTDGAVVVIDFSDPDLPVQIARIETTLMGASIAVKESTLFLVGSSESVEAFQVYDLLPNPEEPRLLGTSGEALSSAGYVGIAISETLIGITGNTNAITLLPAPCSPSAGIAGAVGASSAFRLGVPHPNPMGAITTVRLERATSGRVFLGVFDVAGRRVAALENSWLPAGSGEWAWTGRDDRGGLVPTGAYFLRAQVDDHVGPGQRIVLVR